MNVEWHEITNADKTIAKPGAVTTDNGETNARHGLIVAEGVVMLGTPAEFAEWARGVLASALAMDANEPRPPQSGDMCRFGDVPGTVEHYRCDDYADGTITDRGPSGRGRILKAAKPDARKGFQR